MLVFSPDLKIGTILAILSCDGTEPADNDNDKTCLRGTKITGMIFFKKDIDILLKSRLVFGKS